MSPSMSMLPISTVCWPRRMTDKVDALFSGDLPTSTPIAAQQRLLRLKRTLWLAVILDILGLPCWTSVPGAVLTLWVWLSTDTDLVRIEAGEYSDEDAARLMRIRRIATWALILCVASLVVQIFLLSTTFYERFWGSLSVGIQHLWHGV
jgi:hypothetical protein